MSPLTAEWVAKAEGDYTTSGREWRAHHLPNYDSACFHAQQMAEKYLKGFLQENGIAFPKTHNLITLLTSCLSVDVTFALQRPNLDILDEYSVRYRYPGNWADKNDARQAYRAATDVRRFVRGRLGLP